MTLYPLNRDGTDYDVLGIGNAIVDVLSRVDDEFLLKEGMSKGAMTLIDAGRAEALYANLPSSIECSGGSVANSVAAIASLGGRAAFMARLNDDALGEIYRHDLRATGVYFESKPATGGALTGRCYVCVTPDGERTMNTYLGACTQFEGRGCRYRHRREKRHPVSRGLSVERTGRQNGDRRRHRSGEKAGRSIAFTLSRCSASRRISTISAA